jgi:hypothetical protein
MNIHDHSVKVFQIVQYTKETGIEMGRGTGFFCSYNSKLYLVSNYHVLSGLHPKTKETLHPKGCVPGEIKFNFVAVKQISTNKFQHSDCSFKINLFDKKEKPVWKEHPTEKFCDVVAIDITTTIVQSTPKDFQVKSIDLHREIGYQTKIGIMDRLFITGYPLEVKNSLSKYPIYKLGMIASEPADQHNGNRFYVDSKTKSGMSGSPVIQKEEGSLTKSGNKFSFSKDRVNFIGIYSGRAELGKTEYEAELGIVWPFKEFLIPIL